MNQNRNASLGLIMASVVLIAGCATEGPTSQSASESASSPNASAAGGSESQTAPAIEVVDQVAEISCGECQFGMEGNSCDLAVRIDGTTYFVDGFTVDDFGDAHAGDGLCNAIKQARVTGRIEGGRFIATAIEVLPE